MRLNPEYEKADLELAVIDAKGLKVLFPQPLRFRDSDRAILIKAMYSKDWITISKLALEPFVV